MLHGQPPANSVAERHAPSHIKPKPRGRRTAYVQNAHIHQGNKASGTTSAITGQYAETTPSHTPVSQPINHHPCAHQQHDSTTPSSAYQQGKREGAAWRIAARRYCTSASSSRQPDRKPRRSAAQLDKVALKKTWDGSKRRQRHDRLSEAEKFSASVWSAAAANGLAVSLNLGISREAMLRTHANPKRRMTQNLSKHLSEAGLGHLPYAFVFELTPEREGGRLHLHGVMDISGLTSAEVERLNVALVRAASVASGAIGGQRQLDLVPIHDPVGWTDYLLKDATRTARELGLDDPFMISKPMRRMAKTHFDLLRSEVRNREETNVQLRSKPGVTPSTGTKCDRSGFTLRSRCDTRRLSGERDKKSAGGVRKQARHQPRGQRQASARSHAVSTAPVRPDAMSA
ncbi:hypothetical protein KM031_22405 (plasmid) [Gemmobacter fulvus]|uniref:Uncharacterized protein n=1 Tax=Gemmobacter fulvus TaxID=2840474 RepID=A0A975PDP2_9RHOB|nr:hypothetical protein [Gemmobacter fulvus]MBT9247922.1 hypothetical protein [Gemmobacter fulvus]QWK93266.1 hypothetical protein KM031_22405 [Gemmobacter fulvus]